MRWRRRKSPWQLHGSTRNASPSMGTQPEPLQRGQVAGRGAVFTTLSLAPSEQSRTQNAERRIENSVFLHSKFCVLHSAFILPPAIIPSLNAHGLQSPRVPIRSIGRGDVSHPAGLRENDRGALSARGVASSRALQDFSGR